MTSVKSNRLKAALAVATLTLGSTAYASEKPTVVLVHGAFAESSSWSDVVKALKLEGYPVIAAANPLRSLSGDADYISSVVKQTVGPVVLVGHSYGGAVISNAVKDSTNVKALVYVAAFAPEQGETVLKLSNLYPGSTLGSALAAPVVLQDGNKDLYIQQDKFGEQFAADVPTAQATVMATTQRPITEHALTEPSARPAWHKIPSWAIYGTADKNIPAVAMKFMAQRAKAKKIVEVPDASHVVMTSHPDKVAALIVEAAKAAVE